MVSMLMGAILALGFALLPPAGPALAERLAQWPGWQLPAPLARPGHGDLVYPAWFAGTWQVADDDGLNYRVRFQTGRQDNVVGDRAYNASALGAALLGDTLLGVENDPRNPNRQIARLRAPGGIPVQLESRVIGRRSDRIDNITFLADELALQVLHGPGAPRVSRVETLSRFELEPGGAIAVQQWQATYASPAEGLAARPLRTQTSRLRMERLRSDPPGPGSDPAS